jgi:hypothetical protein
MAAFWQFIGAGFIIGWIGLTVWSWFSKTKSGPPSAEAERDRMIGQLVGMMGGDVQAAAQVRYAISRLEEELGRPPTLHEVAVAVGITLGPGSSD